MKAIRPARLGLVSPSRFRGLARFALLVLMLSLVSSCMGITWVNTRKDPWGGRIGYPAEGMPFVQKERRAKVLSEMQIFCGDRGEAVIDREWTQERQQELGTSEGRADDLSYIYIDFTCRPKAPESTETLPDQTRQAPREK